MRGVLPGADWTPVLDCVRYHHAAALRGAAKTLPVDSPAYLVYLANLLSGAADRRETEGESDAYRRELPLDAVFTHLNGSHPGWMMPAQPQDGSLKLPQKSQPLSAAVYVEAVRTLEAQLPQGSPLNILDVGTGTGFFAILMAKLGHKVTGIDLTPAMLEEAAAMAAGLGLDIAFRHMDAQQLDFPDGTFDVVLSRNLTWTLPEPEKAYAQWHRVLKPGGLLLNFDADYAANVRSESTQNCSVAPDSPYGHVGMTEALVEENNAITLALDVGQKRPAWDEAVLKKVGFSHCRTDLTVGRRVLGAADLVHAPMFGVFAQK